MRQSRWHPSAKGYLQRSGLSNRIIRSSISIIMAAETTLGSAPAPPSAAGRRPRVAVVGAGFAGLAAALTLQRGGGCEVVVLEAGSRPGGRACTQRISAEMALELGATWFHGLGDEAEPNPVFEHAVEQGLIDRTPEAERWWSSQFLLPGASEPLTKEQKIAVTHALASWTAVVEELPQDAQGTTASHLLAAWEQLLASGKLDSQVKVEAARRAWRWREMLQRAMDGCHSTTEQSSQGLALYDEMPGGVHAPLPAGMQTVAERLAAQLPDVRYQHTVQRIDWGSGSSGSSSSNNARGSSSGVTLTCCNGASIEADAAVVTVSLGVLKAQHTQLFHPALPTAKADAIERLSIGVVDKLILDFTPQQATAAAAEEKATTCGSAATAGDAPAVEASSSGGYSGHDAQGNGPVVSFALLWSSPWQGFAGSGGGSKKEELEAEQAASSAQAVPAAVVAQEAQLPDWVRGVFSLRFGGPEVKRLSPAAAGGAAEAAVKTARAQRERSAGEGEAEVEPEYQPCTEAAQPTCYQAVSWVTGAEAEAMEAAAEEEVVAALRRVLQLYPQLQLPPGATVDGPIKLYRSSWGSDPLFRGSYSYLSPGASPADVAALAAPLPAPAGGSEAPVLLFAGEACHVQYIGTMHGAYLTGQQAAQLLLQHYKQQAA